MVRSLLLLFSALTFLLFITSSSLHESPVVTYESAATVEGSAQEESRESVPLVEPISAAKATEEIKPAVEHPETTPAPKEEPPPRPASTPLPAAIVPEQKAINTPPLLQPEIVNEKVRASLVNILCEASPPLRSTSGSGIIIDSSGIILTNAHIAQYYLLQNTEFPVSCTVRTGSPARSKWHAELAFLPHPWIEKHAPDILSSKARGTGEYDFAFLKITESTDGTPFPTFFPSIPVDASEAAAVTGDFVTVAGYPAEFIGGAAARNSLYATTVFASIAKLLTFTADLVDVVSVSGTALAQSGSSGGAFINTQGSLVGLIVTTTIADTTGARDLHAITPAYMERGLKTLGTGLSEVLRTIVSKKDTSQDVELEKQSEILRQAIHSLRN